jgi:hypothetical protein
MEDVPPSYQSAINREAWIVIAPYIPSKDLCSACLVCQKWHNIFIPFLWGDPASHFGIENDEVYVALTRFKRTLRKSRASVRQLTHTLHLPPAVSEIYGGPNPTWLREVLEYLPNLQSLVVSKLPFFDHHSLVALRTPIRRTLNGAARQSFDEDDLPLFGLKLLLATSEPNSTSAGLAAALPRFPHLVYLDLSYTSPARDVSVLAALSGLHDLQVLKLRGIGLRDSEAEVLANAIGIKVRLLDIAENLLTDMAVRSLLQACFLPSQKQSNGPSMNSRRVEDWPVGMAPGPDFFSLDTLRNEHLDHELLKQLTNPLTGRLAFEDIPHRGLTHLYIADNHLSVEGLASLLKSERLHILDGGTADAVKIISRTQSLSSPTGYIDEVRFPGAEKLIPILAGPARKNLTYLRINHAVVTEQVDISKEIPKPTPLVAELKGTQSLVTELPSDERHIAEAPGPAHYAVEMSADPIYELDSTPAAPKYELPGDLIHFAISPPIGDAPAETETLSPPQLKPNRASGVFAPELVTDEYPPANGHVSDEEEEVVLNASGTGMASKKPTKIDLVSPTPGEKESLPSSPISPEDSLGSKSSQTHTVVINHPVPQSATSTARLAHIDALVQKRPAAFNPVQNHKAGEPDTAVVPNLLAELHPAVLPNLRSLILTSLPTSVPKSSPILSSLKRFISACADEDALSHLLAKTNYSLPPGRARKDAEMHHAKSLFALTQIILEMDQADQTSAKAKLQTKGWKHLRKRASMSKSSTGDRDSENFISAAENDFSFFGEEGEEQDECGIYQHDPEKYFPTSHVDGLIAVSPEESSANQFGTSPNGSINSTNFSRTIPRSPTILRGPRDLPLGRPRRSSSSASSRPSIRSIAEVQGSYVQAPTSQPRQQLSVQPPSQSEEPMIDLIAELAKWRKERRSAYEEAVFRWRAAQSGILQRGTLSRSIGEMLKSATLRDDRDMPFVEGHWKGEIKVIRNSAPKGRTGVVDVYGNYFEKGYLYP